MRVTRESLIRIAKETAQERAFNDPTIVAAYLTGSLHLGRVIRCWAAPPTSTWSWSTRPQPGASRQIVKLTPDFHLDIRHRPRIRFQIATGTAHGSPAGLGAVRPDASV